MGRLLPIPPSPHLPIFRREREGLRAYFAHVLGSGQIRHQVVAGGEGVGKVVHLLPLAADGAAVGAVAVYTHLHAVFAGERVTAASPQGERHLALRQVGLSLQVDGILAAAAAHVDQGRRRVGLLHNFRAEAVDIGLLGTLPGSLDLVLRRGGSGHRRQPAPGPIPGIGHLVGQRSQRGDDYGREEQPDAHGYQKIP